MPTSSSHADPRPGRSPSFPPLGARTLPSHKLCASFSLTPLTHISPYSEPPTPTALTPTFLLSHLTLMNRRWNPERACPTRAFGCPNSESRTKRSEVLKRCW